MLTIMRPYVYTSNSLNCTRNCVFLLEHSLTYDLCLFSVLYSGHQPAETCDQ